MHKILLSGPEGREALLRGVSKLYGPVSATLGPRGRNILIEGPNGKPTVTKDGVSVANEIVLEDPVENQGAELVKEAAAKTNDAAGDGTTTATILAHAMMVDGLEYMKKSSANAILVKRGMEQAVLAITNELKARSKTVKSTEDLAAIATISSQDPAIGELIATVIDKVGEHGVITVEDGQSASIESRFVEGMQIESGFKSPYLINDVASRSIIFEKCHILVTDATIRTISQIVEPLEALAQKGIKEIAIFAEDFDQEVVQTVVLNKIRGSMNVALVKAPSFGETKKAILKDLAILSGAAQCFEELGLPVEKARANHLGFVKKIIVDENTTTIWGGSGKQKDIDFRLEEIRAVIDSSTSDFEIATAQKRLARLSGGVAVISVGGSTEVERQERKHRVEDALSATKAAAAEGILPGGGTALLRACQAVQALQKEQTDVDVAAGWSIVMKAAEQPIRVLAGNAGASASDVVEKVSAGKDDFGWNALTGEYEDLLKARVIDPTLVTRSALENAASVAGMFLTLEGVCVRKPLNVQEQALAALGGRA